MYYLPILGAIALATATIMQRMILRKKTMNIKFYQSAEFLAIVLASLPLLYFFWRIDSGAFSLKNILIFVLVIVFSIIANILTYYSMKWEKVSNLEPAKMLEPLFVIIFAIIFSFLFEGLYERNFNIIIPALIAAGALVFSHIKRYHLDFNKYFIAAIVGSIFFALELIISRLILDYYSPVTFYFLRCISIAILSTIIFRPKYQKLENKVKWQILAIGAIWVIYRVAIYYGYLYLGVVSTTLMIMLGPIFIYLFAWKFLKEKLSWRNIVAAVVILACILYATLG